MSPLRLLSTLALTVLVMGCTTTDLTQGGPVRSVGTMTFVDGNTLVIADWRGGELHAFHLPPAASPTPKPFNLRNVSALIARALRTDADRVRFEDLAFRPGAELAYVTLSIENGADVPTPVVVSIDAVGTVTALDLAETKRTSVEIKSRPAADKVLWRDIPEASFLVTDIVFYGGKLYVAGLSNASFASTLRVFDFPFTAAATATSIEMYHPVHNQLETRAPIRSMSVVTLNGEPSLVAAFTCTPLVTIPLKDFQDGAHVVAKTVAELGWGSAPVDMVTFDAEQQPMILITNSHKSADLIPVAAVAEASRQPGLQTPIKWPSEPLLGLRSTYIPMSGLAHLETQNADFFGALRRNQDSGRMELMSIRKGAFLRLSDFVNEYDFASFTYGPADPFRGLHQILRTDEGYTELAGRAKP